MCVPNPSCIRHAYVDRFFFFWVDWTLGIRLKTHSGFYLTAARHITGSCDRVQSNQLLNQLTPCSLSISPSARPSSSMSPRKPTLRTLNESDFHFPKNTNKIHHAR